MEQEKLTGITYKIKEMAERIRELREISGFTVEEMARRTNLSVEEYMDCESGAKNLSIAFLYRCTLSFGVDMGDLLAMAWPKYYVQVSGVEDSIFPISGAEEVFAKGKRAYESRGQEDRCALVRGAGGHRFYADDAWPVVHGYLDKTDI